MARVSNVFTPRVSPQRWGRLFAPLLISVALLLSACTHSNGPNQSSDAASAHWINAVDLSHRSQVDQARDQYRHPRQTLAFFELQPSDRVVEIWPGGGWYTQILAPLLKRDGQLIAAHWPHDSGVDFFRTMRQRFDQTFLAQPQRYGNIRITQLEPPSHTQLAADNSVDKVFTFRNVHNWMRNQQQQTVFNAAFAALKPGGILGVVEHRAPEDFSLQQMINSGYVSEAYVKQLAASAGFEFVAASEVNANPADDKQHPRGVWTLPPSLRLGELHKARYLAIGESDRMTLKFRKPLN